MSYWLVDSGGLSGWVLPILLNLSAHPYPGFIDLALCRWKLPPTTTTYDGCTEYVFRPSGYLSFDLKRAASSYDSGLFL